ncbi:MAG: hypothetical protein JNK87_21085 [Bryobacterales bacterium]|nr:hypothetical protein [Bryobacterales bacterium]
MATCYSIMVEVILPERVRHFIEEFAAGVPFAELQKAVHQLSDHYRAGKNTAQLKLPAQTRTAAYLLTRLPATYAAAYAVLRETQARIASWQPQTLLDLGAGTGAATLAAEQILPSLLSVVQVERESFPSLAALPQTNSPQDLRTWKPEAPANLTIAAYTLGELPAEARTRLIAQAWPNTQTLILIEPGSPRGFDIIRQARRQLLDLGATLAAPCPAHGDCPVPPNDWCHFAQRLERSALHRRLKDAALSYEDEKFSYVAATRLPVERPAARVLRRPTDAPGLVTLEICRGDAIVTEKIAKRDKDRFRAARKVRWGEPWPPSTTPYSGNSD